MPINVFGVRHLSPSGAWHLRRFLDAVRPEVVLVECMSDCESLIPDIIRTDSEPPIAILAYTDSQPVKTIVYPLANYSPEYQAFQWADEHDAAVRLIDLPSDVFLALERSTTLRLSPRNRARGMSRRRSRRRSFVKRRNRSRRTERMKIAKRPRGLSRSC
jgi:hypothetical protein